MERPCSGFNIMVANIVAPFRIGRVVPNPETHLSGWTGHGRIFKPQAPSAPNTPPMTFLYDAPI